MNRTIRTVTIENKRGLHARASMAFVTLATAQSVELTVEKDGNTASGTSILDLMMLGAAKGDTIWMGVIDNAGRAVSFIQSVYWEFGSGTVLRDTGVCWQNRGTSFSLDPSALNTLEDPAATGPASSGTAPGLLPLDTMLRNALAARPGNIVMRQLFGHDKSGPSMFSVMVGSLNIIQDRLSRSRLAGDPPDVVIACTVEDKSRLTRCSRRLGSLQP